MKAISIEEVNKRINILSAIAQQQILEAQQRYYQVQSGGYSYGGGGGYGGARPF